MDYYTSTNANLRTGVHPDAVATVVRHLTLPERGELWFIEPLKKMSGDAGIIALMVCFPLIEKIIRYRLKKNDEDDLVFSDGSDELRELAKLLGKLSDADAKIFWQCFRHGLMHRAMIGNNAQYDLLPGKGKSLVVIQDGRVIVYVWQIRDLVVSELISIGSKIWRDQSCPLPEIYQELK